VEPGARSLETAERIKKLSSEIGIKHNAAEINKGGPERSIINLKNWASRYLEKFLLTSN
ncbi:MAG: dehydrogenase maturation factor, partial [Euryarchaeota archaeon]|nr:dehydrogenase maturation factor [Euryarchaeota archaeon]